MDLRFGEYSVLGLARTNVILGKNGCGKSFLLKRIRDALQNGQGGFAKVRSVSPERGGILEYEAGIEQNIAADPNWIEGQRARNQSSNFRQQSAALFRRVELLTLREIERDHRKADYVPLSFDDTVNKMNLLLDRVRLERHDNRAFKIILKADDRETSAQELSSGEAEVVSLGIEILAFLKECDPTRDNLLLLDEPDVHLHPDLQQILRTEAQLRVEEAKLRALSASANTELRALDILNRQRDLNNSRRILDQLQRLP